MTVLIFSLPLNFSLKASLFIFQNQPYSFWVTASAIQGEGTESAIVAETPQIPVPATIASFSRKVIHAIKEDAVLKCLAVGQPKPTVEWKIK